MIHKLKNVQLLCILIITIINIECYTNPSKKKYSIKIQDTLTPFTATFVQGDNSTLEYKIKVFKQNTFYFASKISPIYFLGKNRVNEWTVKLDKNQLRECLKFINNLKSIKNSKTSSEMISIIKDSNCNKIIDVRNTQRVSTVKEYLTVIMSRDSIHINDGWGFEMLYRLLFYKQLQDLESKKDSLKKSYIQLKGT